MARGIGLLVIALAVMLSGPSHADEWRSQSHEESIIAFDSTWYWAAPEKGGYVETWADGKNSHLFAAIWGKWPSPRLQISVERLTPGFVWRHGPPTLGEHYLERWKELRDNGVSDLEKIQCNARQCVTFKTDMIFNCGALLNYAGALENWTEGVSADASDIVMAYFCVGQSIHVTANHLDKILASIAIKR